MAQIIWTEPALDELNEIVEYIALSNPNAAQQLVHTVFNITQRLEQFPDSGRKPPELEMFLYRELIINPCRVFYKTENDKIYILHVMRQERDLRKFMLGTTTDEGI
jgi:toxin ParE1/3/4